MAEILSFAQLVTLHSRDAAAVTLTDEAVRALSDASEVAMINSRRL